MTDHVYKIVEITGSSAISSDEAVKTALAKASKTIRNMRWFVVTETRGTIENGALGTWQVTLKIGFTLDD